MRARDDDCPDLGCGQALELRGDALDRALRLDVAVEQVAGDQEQVDLLGKREVHGRGECGELPLTLGARLLAEVVVARTEMDVGGMDDRSIRWGRASVVGDLVDVAIRSTRDVGLARARRPHDSPLAVPDPRWPL